MMKTRFRLFALAPLVLSLSAAVAARQAAAPPPGNLVLQVVYFDGAPTAFQLVSPGPGMAWSWFGHFRAIPRPAGGPSGPPVQAVKVSSRAEGAGARIEVTVFTGEQHFDHEEPVGTYAAGVGDEVVVRELERFGVAPFRVTVRRVGLNPAAPPVVVNKTQSVEASVAGFEGVAAKLSLRNLSAKRVQCVEYRETREGRTVWTRFATAEEGRPLIEPGGEYSYGVPRTRRGQVSPDGLFIPEAPETILIASAVFDDGTYEGEPQTAARLAARYEGERLQLARSLALLRQAPSQPGAAARLKAQVAGLGIAAPPAAVESIAKRYPGLTAHDREFMKGSMEVSLHILRQELLDGLAALEKEGAGDARLGEWLSAKREKFEGWLARLPAGKN